MKNKSLLVAIFTLAFFGLYLGSKVMPPRQQGPMDLHAFGALPCVADGREKPFDTVARHTLMMVSDRQFYYDNEGNKQPAVRWLLDVLAGRSEAFDAKVFRIVNLDVLDGLELEPRLEKKSKFRYALNEFVDKMPVLAERAGQASAKPAEQRDVVDHKFMELAERVQVYMAVAQWQTPLTVAPLQKGQQWEALFSVLAGRVGFDQPQQMMALGRLIGGNKAPLLERMSSDESSAVRAVAGILQAYGQADAPAFNERVKAYRSQINTAMPATASKAGFEIFFNRFEPFKQAMAMYIAAMVMVFVGLLRWAGPLNRAALWLGVMTFVIHTAALISRMYLQDRWGVFVTNLYSSAVFIGWGCVGLTLLLEWFYRNGLGTMMAAITGFLTLLVAHNLASDGQDTMQMMEAVLDTNFWLATHVTTVSLGYTATFVAGFLAVVYVLMGLFSGRITPAINKQFGTMIYGTICFAILLSFTGTVLGGIWADQSWGRFWGWDPKENGALMIVIWNALILHARWGGMVRQRGIAALAIFGNIVTSWSWFGTNELGAGLHSYGFTEGRAFWLMCFMLSQLVILLLGLTPLRYWRSFRHAHKPDIEHSPDAIPA